MKKRKTVVFVHLAAAAILLLLVGWIAWENTALELNAYTITSPKLPDSFSGFRIAHISDLHNTEIGDDNEALLAILKKAAPDLIAITGDLIDSRRTDVNIAVAFAKQAMNIAPCYYVTGNHEARVSEYSELKAELEDAGVVVLENNGVPLYKGTDSITILGMHDPSFPLPVDDSRTSGIQNLLNSFWVEDTCYTVLLSHRPELMEAYAKQGADLVLSGHAHGGQFRLPFIGGLIAPNQGLFPKYDSGLFVEGNTSMIVSRGIGNSLFPFRINNRPEVIVIELNHMDR